VRVHNRAETNELTTLLQIDFNYLKIHLLFYGMPKRSHLEFGG